MKRFSVQAVRQALVGKGNLRTILSDKIKEIDPYKRDAGKKFIKIYNEQATQGWLQIQNLFTDIPKITTLENAWSVTAQNSELIALLLRGVYLEKDKLIVSRSRKLLKLTKIENDEDTFGSWLFSSNTKRLPNLITAAGFSPDIRVRWGLAKNINENVTCFSELIKTAALVETLKVNEASDLLKEAISHLRKPINRITQDEATCFTDEQMRVFSYDKELITEIYEDTENRAEEIVNKITKLQKNYRANVSCLTGVVNSLSQRDWQTAGAYAEKIELDRTAKIAAKNSVTSAKYICEITSHPTTKEWTAMSKKGYGILYELLPKGSMNEHWTYNASKIIRKIIDLTLAEQKLTQIDILQLNQTWSDENKIALIESQKFLLINQNSPTWKYQSLKTLMHSASVRSEEDAAEFLFENLSLISGPEEILTSIIEINDKRAYETIKEHINKWLGYRCFMSDEFNASNWDELLARTVGTSNWLIAREKDLIDNTNIDQVLQAIEVLSENRLLEAFKKISIKTLDEIHEFSEDQAIKIISALKNDSTFIEILGPNLKSNVIEKISEVSELDSSEEVIQKLYEVVKDEHKFTLWKMQINHVTQAKRLIALGLEGMTKGYKLKWVQRWKHVSGSIQDKARALSICTADDPSRLKKIRVDFTEELLKNALMWASEKIPVKFKYKKVYLELTSMLGVRNASTLQWLLIQRMHAMPAGGKLDHLYAKHEILKKSGKTRVISAPHSGLKRIQKSININLLEPLGAHEAAYGFVKGKSIVGNAKMHVGKDVVVNVDVKNCFPSVKWPLVHAALKRDLSNKISPSAISALIDLCLAEGVLPIGAPTSPALLNRVLYKTDEILTKQAEIKNCTYSRYADDLTFSGSDSSVGLIATAKKTLSQIGLELDENKTNIFRRGRRQMCTGLVVNDKVNIPRTIRKRIRASVHAYELSKELYWEGLPVGESSLRGRIEFLKMVSPHSSKKLQNRFSEAHQLKIKSYSKQKKKIKLKMKVK